MTTTHAQALLVLRELDLEEAMLAREKWDE